MGQQQPPSPPNPAQTYSQGLQTFMKFLPQMLKQEYGYRGQYDPKFIEQQQGLQAKYGPTQYAQQLAALQQLDPWGEKVRGQLGQSVSGDLSLGGDMTGAMKNQFQSEIRGAQTARGGSPYGAAGTYGEAAYQSDKAQQLYQQRLNNAGQFLNLRTPEANMAFVNPVQAPNQFQFVNPNAGYLGQQIGQQGYQNQLAAYSLGNQGGGWQGALGGAASGAAAGGSFGGGYGAAAGAVLGGVGGYFSDRRLKQNIKYTGEKTRDGIPRAEFDMDGKRMRGVIAQDVFKVRPDAVFGSNGFLGVYYDMLGLKMEEV